MYYSMMESPLCPIFLVGDESGLQTLFMDTGNSKDSFEIQSAWVLNDGFFDDVRRQLDAYFGGKPVRFDVKLNLIGTEWQRRVWGALCEIPFGAICTYGEVATQLGNPKGSRAVGNANSMNPVPIIVPCHRVLGAGGLLGGYSHGLETKLALLKLEGIDTRSMKMQTQYSLL